MENKFTLPEKWYMEVTEENFAKAKQWQQRMTNGAYNGLKKGYTLLSGHKTNTSFYYANSKIKLSRYPYYDDYKEITTEQFIEHVYNPTFEIKQQQPSTLRRFSSAKIGDKVYCLKAGEGKIVGFTTTQKYPIVVEFKDGSVGGYNLDGFEKDYDATPMLYWSMPKIIESPRYEEVEIEGYWFDDNFYTEEEVFNNDILDVTTKGEQAKIIVKRKIN